MGCAFTAVNRYIRGASPPLANHHLARNQKRPRLRSQFGTIHRGKRLAMVGKYALEIRRSTENCIRHDIEAAAQVCKPLFALRRGDAVIDRHLRDADLVDDAP